MPIITLKSLKDVTRTSAKGKKYKALEVVGTNVVDNQQWSTDIFKSQTDIVEKFDDFGAGETVNIRFQKNGTFWDVVDVTEASEEEIKQIKSKPTGGPSSGGKGGWNGRTGDAYDRSASIYLAYDMIKGTTTEASLRKMDVFDLLANTIEIAEDVFSYIHDGKTPMGSDESPFVEDDDDPLEPPVD